MFLSIITPTYNRDYCLPLIYNSLLTNEKQDFEWIIINDGSTDKTDNIVNDWTKQNKINIRYIKQSNQGKTEAVINGFKIYPKGEYTLVLDSDDFLVENIIINIYKELLTLKKNQIGIAGLKSDLTNNIIGSSFLYKECSYSTMYFGDKKTSGDKLFIIKTKIYAKSMVPVFKGEKLIPEGVFYIKMGKYGDFKCINEILYKGDYLKDGLSYDVLKLSALNINGFILEKNLLQNEKLSISEKLINEIKYISYSIAGSRNMKKILKKSHNKILTLLMYIPTYILTFRHIQKIKKLKRTNG